MSLLLPGDPRPHTHELPSVPYDGRWARENAVASCAGCQRLFVSREEPDGWGRTVRWVPLRWWHRRARRELAARLRA